MSLFLKKIIYIFSLIKDFFCILFTRPKTNTDDRKPLILTCPRMDEEVIIDARHYEGGKIIVGFSHVKKEISKQAQYILPEKEIKICEELRRDAEGCIMTIGQKANVEEDILAIFVFFDNLRLDLFSISPLEPNTIETQFIDVDFTIHPAVWIGFFDQFALGEMITQYRGEYRIILNQERTIARIIFQEEPAENIETFAVADKMLVLLSKKVHYLAEIIIGGIAENTD